MPIEIGIWKLGPTMRRIRPEGLDAEKRLEDAIAGDLSMIAPGLMLLGRQVATDSGKQIDLLAIDREGNLLVVELKRHRTPREVVAQLLDYASWVHTLNYKTIKELFERAHADQAFEAAFAEVFDEAPPEDLNESHQLIVVCAELDPSTERIIDYLSQGYGVPINAMFFRYFRDGDSEYLTRTWLIDPHEAEAKTTRADGRGRKRREPWNGRDYYVSFVADEHRNWDDARTYGFTSAGGAKWYSQTLYNLEPGNRVFVYIPKRGFVAVGEVIEAAVPIRDFSVDVDGTPTPFLDAPRNGYRAGANVDNDEKCEHVVKVRWIRAVPEVEAYWEQGLFAKQHSACRMRNRFTIEKLQNHFALED